MANEKLIAACGTYCGACEMYRPVQDNNQKRIDQLLKRLNSRGGHFTVKDIECDGCLANGKITSWCRACAMKNCEKHKGENRICSPECGDFPCEILSNFSKDRMPHHHELVENLERLHKVGLKKHAAQEEKRWQCPQCKQPMSWYARECPKCGAPRSEKLFKLERELPPEYA